ncbi:RagB/SusD family nutrient uptake outer membrane protein [Olivibacter jilunii]|uniref:RagB/SusD family nutrient uptake outer membrane protein n=1 Tax=Olivibacter jilunii TaxID=985016 RepID=UPI0010316E96|nr:RagB/SusD family nutrient uptake outer membrane protein [Olivibacter jilunii]
MRRNYVIISLCLSLLALSACHDELLNPVPESSLTNVNFYRSADDIDQAVLGIYGQLQLRKPTDYQLLEIGTDNLYMSTNTVIAGIPEVDGLTVSTTNPLVLSFWQSTYNGIFRANAVLANIDTPTDYPSGMKEQYRGEAKFMRALFYFDLVRVFGAVPLVTTPISAEEATNVGRTDAEAVYQLIIADLTGAVDLLPLKGAIASGRCNRETALGLLAKVYVSKNDWQAAKQTLDRFFTEFGSTFSLMENFGSLWQVATENNAEVLFAMKYTDGTNGHSLSTAFIPNAGVPNVVSRGAEIALPSWSLHKLFDEEDSRKTATIAEQYVPALSPGDDPIWYPYVSKYAITHTFNASGLDLPVLRYADIILLHAETLNELGQLNAALSELNKVRARAFGNTTHNYTAREVAGQDEFTDVLLKERQLEFAFENERWFDLVRKEKFVQVLQSEERNYNPANGQAQVVPLQPAAYMQLFPIPQAEIDLVGSSVLTQNPGY